MPYQAFDPSRYAGSIGDLIMRRGDIEAQRAQTVANAQSQAQQIRGQAWGGAMQNIAGSVGDAINGYMREKQEAPLRAQRLESERLQNEAARMQIAGAKQAAEDKSILGSAQGSGMEPDAVKAQLAQLGRGDLIPIYEQTHANLETARLGLQEQRTKVQGLEADYFGAMAAGVKKANMDPIAVEWALAQADADGHDTKQLRELLKQKPDALPQLIDGLIEKSPTQRKLLGEEAERTLKTATENRMAEQARQAAADKEADNKRADTQAAEVARHNAAMERIGTMTAGRSGAAQEETARHNRAMEDAAKNQKVTGAQRKVLGFFNRMLEAERNARSVENSVGGRDFAAEWLPGEWLENFAKSDEGQKYTQAQRTFTEGRLRKESGAAIPLNEYETDRSTNFKRPNDTAENVAQKRAARLALLKGAANEAGPALQEYFGSGATIDDLLSEFSDSEAMVPATVGGQPPKEGTIKPIDGFPGAEQTFRGGKWIRTK